MPELTPPTRLHRRWFTFSLRTLFVVVTVGCVWLGYSLNWIQRRHAFMTAQEVARGRPGPLVHQGERTAPKMLCLFGENGYEKVEVWLEGEAGVEDAVRLTANDHENIRVARRLFPEADLWIANEKRDQATGRSSSWSRAAWTIGVDDSRANR